MNKKVAIVEDDQAISTMYRIKFEAEGFTVETAANGKLGLELIEHMKPDIVLLDLMMPEMNGYDFMRAHRAESDTPIIMLTAKVEDDDKIIGLELGADDYVTKPFKPVSYTHLTLPTSDLV